MSNTNKSIDYGKFSIGDTLIVRDPCYPMDEDSCVPARPGTWSARAEIYGDGMWGERVAVLDVSHEGYEDAIPCSPLDFGFGVDSAQCGVYDADYFAEHAKEPQWYWRVCDLTCGGEQGGVIDGSGVVTSTGFGDGYYYAEFACDDEGCVVRAVLTFIEDDDDDEAW